MADAKRTPNKKTHNAASVPSGIDCEPSTVIAEWRAAALGQVAKSSRSRRDNREAWQSLSKPFRDRLIVGGADDARGRLLEAAYAFRARLDDDLQALEQSWLGLATDEIAISAQRSIEQFVAQPLLSAEARVRRRTMALLEQHANGTLRFEDLFFDLAYFSLWREAYDAALDLKKHEAAMRERARNHFLRNQVERLAKAWANKAAGAPKSGSGRRSSKWTLLREWLATNGGGVISAKRLRNDWMNRPGGAGQIIDTPGAAGRIPTG